MSFNNFIIIEMETLRVSAANLLERVSDLISEQAEEKYPDNTYKRFTYGMQVYVHGACRSTSGVKANGACVFHSEAQMDSISRCNYRGEGPSSQWYVNLIVPITQREIHHISWWAGGIAT